MNTYRVKSERYGDMRISGRNAETVARKFARNYGGRKNPPSVKPTDQPTGMECFELRYPDGHLFTRLIVIPEA